ncbi:MAG: serine/threonine-protein kinase [Gemmatimonadales bacterium]|jgi:serine/threonine protein kinase
MDSGHRDRPDEESAADQPESQADDSAAPTSSAASLDDETEALLKRELAPELEIVRRLGVGAMATVYLAREESLKRLVAVKVLSPRHAADPRSRMRFERESQAVASLAHPNIVPIYRVGRLSNDLPYFVMQYVKGSTMAERLQARGALGVAEARRVLSEIASALAAAHSKGIVHRDVRAGNVLYEEATGRAMLADFGIAAILASGESGAAPRLTKTGERVGDPNFMSPEQLRGDPVSERSDLYALGLLGYEMAVGRGPYEAKSRREQITAHIKQEPRKLSELQPAADLLLEDVLLRCLAKEPEHRPSATDVVERLKAPAAEPSGPMKVSPSPTPGWIQRVTERRMPQIVIAYVIVGWGLLQVAGFFAEHGMVSELVVRLVLVATVTGLPAVVTGAWFHGKRGRQRFEPVEYWVFGGLALIWLIASVAIVIGWTGI